MSRTSQIMTALAQRLADDEFGVFRPDGLYSADERGITIQAVPDQPNELIALSLYHVDEDSPSAHTYRVSSTLVIQVRVRFKKNTLPNAQLDLIDDLRESLHWKADQDYGGHHITLSEAPAESVASLGPDAAGRPEWSFRLELSGLRAL